MNLTYFSLFSMDSVPHLKVDTEVQNRMGKCTVILTREIMGKFTTNPKEYLNLLTILMQLL